MTGPRILSLLPSATEIAVAVGRGEGLVGRSHECDFPPFVEALPVCTATISGTLSYIRGHYTYISSAACTDPGLSGAF